MAVTKVVMPKLSEAMESGKIIKWLKKEGDRIQGGDILAEVETDKADIEMEAFGAGVLRKILAPAGESVPVGALIGVIAEPGDDVSALLASAPAPALPSGAPALPSAAPALTSAADVPPARPAAPAASAPAPPAPAPSPVAPLRPATVAPSAPTPMRPAAVTSAPAAQPSGGRVKASPLAKKIAAQTGVDLRLLQGTGPGGRIVRRDVETAGAAPAAVRTVSDAEFEDRPLSPMRAAIARQMPLSKGPVPHFYVTNEVAMDRAWELREELNALEGQPKISLNDLIIRACALALLQHPGVTASSRGDAGLGVGRRMALTISCDHRVMDGAMGARFLQDVKRLLEEPLRLLI